jgi:hypothetical protein
LKNVITEKLGDANATMADPDDQHPDFCPVFVVATEGQDAGGPEKLFRSYGFYVCNVGQLNMIATTYVQNTVVQLNI